jgi:MoaA/NifB/PqqE/SkfB family radical SAM enzyme
MLSDKINKGNIEGITQDLLDYELNDSRIEVFKFSGFMGEPLIQKDATLRAIDMITDAGRKVGLFTNGILLTKDTYWALLDADYVHISLDGGMQSFSISKGCDDATFHKILHNIWDLHKWRNALGSKLKINVGYVVTEKNYPEIWTVTQAVKRLGADMIRFKVDITQEKQVFEFRHVIKEFSDELFDISVVCFGKPAWNRSMGCHFYNYMTTIGSDGKVYVCDHNSMKKSKPLGDMLTQKFADIWENRAFTCESDICPPFGSDFNLKMDVQDSPDLRS